MSLPLHAHLLRQLESIGADVSKPPTAASWAGLLAAISARYADAERALTEERARVATLEAELHKAQKLEAVGRLAAGIAHEINTPVQFIGNNVTFLATAFQDLLSLCATYRELCDKAMAAPLGPADAEARTRAEEAADLDYATENVPRALAATDDGVKRVASIVQSMKNFAFPDRGERTTADINAAVQSTITVAAHELKYVADIETELGPVPPLPCFLGDLNQVVLNLLVNASHAIEDVVKGSGGKGVIRVKTSADPEHVVVSISDTGTGIPPAVRARIFEPFFTTKGVGKGTGQGLALAHDVIVKKHGGQITVDTEVGKGTTFHLHLPLHPPRQDTA